MKHLIFILPLFFSLQALAIYDTTQYSASNGIVYKIGDLVELGRGAGVQGTYKYLHVSGWGAAIGANTTIGSGYAGTKVSVKRISIEYNRRKNYRKIWFMVGGGNITNYSLEIEQAIQECEVIPCIGKGQIENKVSTADELIKLKKLKDDGVLTDAEFEQQKKKLLSN